MKGAKKGDKLFSHLKSTGAVAMGIEKRKGRG